MAAELNRDISDEERESFEEMTKELEGIIKEMQAQMGRFPTQDEVVMFVWGTDKEREDILNKGRSNDS